MQRLHICNTFFEAELEETKERSLLSWMTLHPAITQLQFLPLLYAGPDDLILVSQKASCSDPRLRLLSEPLPDSLFVEDWGPSKALHTWAQEKQISYPAPDWERIRTLNSKLFSFCHSPKLPQSASLYTEQEVQAWLSSFKGPKVLKTLFGTAGNGHFHPDTHKNLSPFLQKQFRQQLPVIGEPWVERVFDFSTQWEQGKLLGATVFETEAKGTYKATLAGASSPIFGSYLWALEEHLSFVQDLFKQIGPYGNLGIDAYVYRWHGKELLQPVVEINGRKTMSWVALQMQQKDPHRTLRFCFDQTKEGLLPSLFSRNVTCFFV